MIKCRKCGRQVQDCPYCRGGRHRSGIFGRLSCSKCRNTGQVCPQHGGHWK